MWKSRNYDLSKLGINRANVENNSLLTVIAIKLGNLTLTRCVDRHGAVPKGLRTRRSPELVDTNSC